MPLGAGTGVISGDGNWVAFVSGSAGVVPGIPAGIGHAYLRELASGQVRLASTQRSGVAANDHSLFPFLGWAGALVGFHSTADNWMPAPRRSWTAFT